MTLFICTLTLTRNNDARVAAAHESGTYIKAQTTIPAAPSNLTVTGESSDSVSIAWTDNSGDEDGFRVEWCTGATCSDFQLLTTMPAGVNSITQWNLAKNKTYKYRVSAYNSAGASAYSNVVAATTTR
jgi:hypothetical protein